MSARFAETYFIDIGYSYARVFPYTEFTLIY